MRGSIFLLTSWFLKATLIIITVCFNPKKYILWNIDYERSKVWSLATLFGLASVLSTYYFYFCVMLLFCPNQFLQWFCGTRHFRDKIVFFLLLTIDRKVLRHVSYMYFFYILNSFSFKLLQFDQILFNCALSNVFRTLLL